MPKNNLKDYFTDTIAVVLSVLCAIAMIVLMYKVVTTHE